MTVSKSLIEECKAKLLEAKEELLNRASDTRKNLYSEEKGGDEGDQTVRALAEREMLHMADRIRRQLIEIESALARIQNGTFGVCEECGDEIGVARLKARPVTRLCINCKSKQEEDEGLRGD